MLKALKTGPTLLWVVVAGLALVVVGGSAALLEFFPDFARETPASVNLK